MTGDIDSDLDAMLRHLETMVSLDVRRVVSPDGDVAIFPNTISMDEWERLSVDFREAQDRDRIKVADIDDEYAEESSESTFGRFTLSRV